MLAEACLLVVLNGQPLGCFLESEYGKAEYRNVERQFVFGPLVFVGNGNPYPFPGVAYFNSATPRRVDIVGLRWPDRVLSNGFE